MRAKEGPSALFRREQSVLSMGVDRPLRHCCFTGEWFRRKGRSISVLMFLGLSINLRQAKLDKHEPHDDCTAARMDQKLVG